MASMDATIRRCPLLASHLNSFSSEGPSMRVGTSSSLVFMVDSFPSLPRPRSARNPTTPPRICGVADLHAAFPAADRNPRPELLHRSSSRSWADIALLVEFFSGRSAIVPAGRGGQQHFLKPLNVELSHHQVGNRHLDFTGLRQTANGQDAEII